MQPLHRQGLTHSATLSSRSVAKHTQQCLHVKYRQGYSGKSKWVSTHGVNCCQNKTQRKDSFDTNRQKKIIVVTTTYTNEATFPCSLPLPLKIMLFTLLYIKQPYYNFVENIMFRRRLISQKGECNLLLLRRFLCTGHIVSAWVFEMTHESISARSFIRLRRKNKQLTISDVRVTHNSDLNLRHCS